MKAPILKGERITLRPLKLSDAPIFRRWFQDKEVCKYLMLQKAPSLASERKWIRDNLRAKDEYTWSFYNESNVLIGNCGLRLKPKDKLANFGIVIGEKREWGKGYAGDVIDAVGNYVFKKLKYQRFELVVFMGNKRALAVYKKAGLRLEGVRRRYHWNMVTKKFEDDGIMSILKEEWEKKLTIRNLKLKIQTVWTKNKNWR